MKKFPRAFYNPSRWLAFSLIMMMTLVVMSLVVGNNVSANHPVLVEGNCDSPVPGTTLVSPGTCGDFDGDGRIGTAEDTDGADRIFGTITAALGPGTGAAAGTGANYNGSITIVTSGRFAESLVIAPGANIALPAPLGNVTLQAAPGVSADINAVLQGDPAGGNNTRQAGIGIDILSNSAISKITLRNLTIRNFATGVRVQGIARVTVDNCRLDQNYDYGIRLVDDSRIAAENLRIASTGFRIPVTGVPTPGHAISFEGMSAGTVYHSQITGSFGAAISNTSTRGATAVRYYEVFLSHNAADIVGATRDNTP
jgi:hypothetical protein